LDEPRYCGVYRPGRNPLGLARRTGRCPQLAHQRSGRARLRTRQAKEPCGVVIEVPVVLTDTPRARDAGLPDRAGASESV